MLNSLNKRCRVVREKYYLQIDYKRLEKSDIKLKTNVNDAREPKGSMQIDFSCPWR